MFTLEVFGGLSAESLYIRHRVQAFGESGVLDVRNRDPNKDLLVVLEFKHILDGPQH